MPCSQSWAFTLQFRSRCITDDDHARCYVPWYREKRSCTLVWLRIEFIPLQTSEYIQRTTKTYILKKFWKVLEPSAQHQLDIPTLGKFGSLWAPGKRVRAKVGVPILCQEVTIFRCTLSPARTHTARCSSTPQEIMETELLETLSPPNICPQWWKRITKSTQSMKINTFVVASCLRHHRSALVVCTYLTNPLLAVLQVYVFSLELAAIFYQLLEERRLGKNGQPRGTSPSTYDMMNELNILLPPFYNTDPIACITFVSSLVSNHK